MIGVEPETSAAGATELDVRLDRPLPADLPVGRASAVFCLGTCFHRRRRVADLRILVDGVSHRPTAQRMPRLDLYRELHPGLAPSQASSVRHDPQSERDPEIRCYRSGFWATIPVGAADRPGELELRAQARLDDGTTASAVLGAIAVLDAPGPPSYDALPPGRPLIAICMATYNPDIGLFRSQVESIRAQTDQDWICLISDDCSDPGRFAQLREVIGDDRRFVISRSERRLSFYRNFERALAMAPAEAELIALSDHDDRWYPDKLAALREAIGSAGLAYSDVRRVDAEGNVRQETLWDGRRNNRTNLASLLISNTIVGASCLFRRRVIDHAMPFPAGPGWDFHDHWLALVAMAVGDVAYVDRPLYDYVQHPGAVLGRTASGAGPPRTGRPWRDVLSRWRSAYFSLYLQREFHAQVLLARCAGELTPRKRRALALMVSAGRTPLAFAWLAMRPARALFGRTETLLVEGTLVRGILWRLLIALRIRGKERPDRCEDDASFPAFAPHNLGRRQRRWLARQ